MNREVHVRFWERAGVKLLRATRQKRPKADVRVESAPPQTADIGRRGWQVSSVPYPDSCSAAKAHHSITSSARASNVGGTVRPSASDSKSL